MSNAIVSLILVALMLFAGMTFSKTAINAFDDMTTSWQEAETTRLEAFRSSIEVVEKVVSPEGVNLYMKNSGQLSIEDYQDWDVIVQYYGDGGVYYIRHLTYTVSGSPADNQWVFNNIYCNEELLIGEVFQPGILDPGEIGLLQLDLAPAAGAGTLGWVSTCYRRRVLRRQFSFKTRRTS